TPILQAIYGGALAKPFKTFHNYLKQDMFLRIAPELYLKRLMVGGFDRVFEIAPCFRNESVDSTHNPEFVQIELYEAYANYERIMDITEKLVEAAAITVTGSTDINYQGHKLSLKAPWKRMKMVDAIKHFGNVDIIGKTDDEIRKTAKKHGVKETGGRLGDVIEKLFSEVVEPKLMQPIFITHFPADISPLAKTFKGEKWAQRFEGYIAGVEMCNAFSELNNPIEQFVAFKQEEELRKQHKLKELEYMPMDKDYIRAMEYGMPPSGGLGIGLGRVFSILFDKPSIKEVLLFPFMAGIEDIQTVAEMFPELIAKKDK
ncbi:MAG: lysine--tRNA ligase, partial [Candidatus Altiarchaeota archaeon]|nr:lysine--tRNA ligase [Candidatus Altiarchaeota archaeon]